METTAAVQAFYAAFNEKDLDALLETVDPHVMFVPVIGPLYDEHIYRGRDGIAAWFGELERRWDGFEAHLEDVHAIGGGVVAFIHLIGRRGERAMDARIAVEFRFRGSRIYRMRGRDLDETAEEIGVRRLAA